MKNFINKYFVADFSNFSLVTTVVQDEEGGFKTTKIFDTLADAQVEAATGFNKIPVVVAEYTENKYKQEIQRLNQRIQDQQMEIDSLINQIEEL